MPHPRRAIRPEEWPKLDQALWHKATEDADPLFEPGGAAHWRAKTLRSVITRYGLWLAWLVEMGLLDPAASPVERAMRERLADYIGFLRARGLASITIAGCIRDLREAARVMEPAADLSIITNLLARLESAAEPSRNKRLRVVSSVLLSEVAIRDMRRLQRGGKKFGPWRTAGGVRDALMVAFLAWRPIRLENLTAIELDRHFAKVENRFWCTFVPAETKEKRPLEFPMPEALTSWLDLYISVHRPLLLRGRKSPRLWISTRSTPMVDNSIYYRVKACTERLVGHPLNPHLFRDCAATTIAELAPEDIGIISRILGHSSLRSAELHYNQAGMLAAGSRYHRTLDEIRG